MGNQNMHYMPSPDKIFVPPTPGSPAAAGNNFENFMEVVKMGVDKSLPGGGILIVKFMLLKLISKRSPGNG